MDFFLIIFIIIAIIIFGGLIIWFIYALKEYSDNNKDKIKEYSEKILEKLGNKYTAKIIGFTIFVKKWRKAVSPKK